MKKRRRHHHHKPKPSPDRRPLLCYYDANGNIIDRGSRVQSVVFGLPGTVREVWCDNGFAASHPDISATVDFDDGETVTYFWNGIVAIAPFSPAPGPDWPFV